MAYYRSQPRMTQWIVQHAAPLFWIALALFLLLDEGPANSQSPLGAGKAVLRTDSAPEPAGWYAGDFGGGAARAVRPGMY
jgi:hypothetical protein